jgi:hypothetical protein
MLMLLSPSKSLPVESDGVACVPDLSKESLIARFNRLGADASNRVPSGHPGVRYLAHARTPLADAPRTGD